MWWRKRALDQLGALLVDLEWQLHVETKMELELETEETRGKTAPNTSPTLPIFGSPLVLLPGLRLDSLSDPLRQYGQVVRGEMQII